MYIYLLCPIFFNITIPTRKKLDFFNTFDVLSRDFRRKTSKYRGQFSKFSPSFGGCGGGSRIYRYPPHNRGAGPLRGGTGGPGRGPTGRGRGGYPTPTISSRLSANPLSHMRILWGDCLGNAGAIGKSCVSQVVHCMRHRARPERETQK